MMTSGGTKDRPNRDGRGKAGAVIAVPRPTLLAARGARDWTRYSSRTVAAPNAKSNPYIAAHRQAGTGASLKQ